jgi:membrane protein
MASIRQAILAIIAALSGAWLGLDLLKGGMKRAARSAGTPRAPGAVATAGAKGGALTLSHPAAVPQTPAPTSRKVPKGKTIPAPSVQQPAPDKPVSAPGAQSEHRDVAGIHGPIGYAKELFARFNGDHCPAWAASLSFFSILSIAPVLLCGLAVLGFLIQDPAEAAAQVKRLVTNLLPGAGAARSANDIIAQLNIEKHAGDLMQKRGVAGLIGLLSLFWAASRIFVNAATPMNAAFRTEEKARLRQDAVGRDRPAVRGGRAVPAVAASRVRAGRAATAPVPAEPAQPAAAPAGLRLSADLGGDQRGDVHGDLPLPALASAGITWKEAAVGGASAAVLWEALKQGFAFYLSHFGGDPNADKVYGALGGLILLVLWIYYSSMVLLMGAEIAKLYSDVQDDASEKQNPAPATA